MESSKKKTEKNLSVLLKANSLGTALTFMYNTTQHNHKEVRIYITNRKVFIQTETITLMLVNIHANTKKACLFKTF